jgi:hypothetical protein
MKYILLGIGYVLTFVVIFILVITALNVSEKQECYKWQENAKTLINFYLTAGEAEQCKVHGIQVIAPIR